MLFLGGIFSTAAVFIFIKLIFYTNVKIQVVKDDYTLKFNSLLLELYIVLGVIGAMIALFLLFQRGLQVPGELFFNLRYAKTVEQLPSYGASHFAIFALISSILLLLIGKKKLSVFMFFIHLIPALALVERTGILYGFMFYMYFYIKK